MHHKHNVMFMLVTILVESSIESEIKAKHFFFVLVCLIARAAIEHSAIDLKFRT